MDALLHVDHEPYYHDRLTERDLCHDFPEDEMYIDGLHAMQAHFYMHNVPVEIPVVRVMNAAHYMLFYAFASTCSGDQMEYDAIAYGSVGHDKKVMLVTLIVMAAMLKRTEGFRAGMCRDLLLENRDEDFYEGVSLYDRFLRSAEKHFAEEDFLIDTHHQILQLQEENTRLTSENIQLKYTLTKMENEKPKTIVYNYGTYNDIHDNPYSTIYAVPPTPEPSSVTSDLKSDTPPSAEAILGIPAEGKYTDVRKYIEERCRFDEEFKAFCEANSRVALCQRLSQEFGWIVDPYGLGRNINRKRKRHP